MTERKPDIAVKVPDRPPHLPDAQVYGPRFDYDKEKTDRDVERLKSYNLAKLGRAVLTFLLMTAHVANAAPPACEMGDSECHWSLADGTAAFGIRQCREDYASV